MGDAADSNSWIMAIRPQNSEGESGEGIEDVIIEDSRFVLGTNTNTDILVVGHRIMTRGNTRVDGDAIAISYDALNAYTNLPAEWRGPYCTQ